METKTFKPSPQFLTKLRVLLTLIAGSILLSGLVLGIALSFDRDIGIGGGLLTIVIIAALDILWWAPGMLVTGPYYKSLSYEILEDEVIVRAGIWTKSVKHVPYRTVTNLTVKRGLLDRAFGLGTLDIQTAGMSGSNTSAEESLEGLPNVDEVYDIVAAELRRFRGSMAPTAAEVEGEPVAAPETLNAILTEIRAIRQSLEKDQ
jgi:membrane protein YdbS with pleckstrin-like domain